MRRQHSALLTLCVAAITALAAASAHAQNFAFAELDDDTLRERVQRLRDSVGELSGAMDADEVLLARTLLLDCNRFDASRTENRIHLVRGGVSSAASGRVVRIDVDPTELARVRGWIVRADGRVERLVSHGGRGGDVAIDPNTPLSLDFGNLGVGDLWGWSAVSTMPYGVDHRVEALAVDVPALRTRIHVKSGAQVTYWAEAVRTDDLDVTVEIREMRDSQPRWVQIDADAVPAHRDAIFSAPSFARDPFVRVTRRARDYPELGTRLLRNDWDQWAALEVGSPTAWLEDSDEVRVLALDVGTRGTTLREQVDLIHTWIEENVALRRPYVPSPLFQNADQALDLDVFGVVDALESFDGPESMSGWRAPFEWSKNEVTGDPQLGRGWRDEPVRPMADVLATGVASALERAVLFSSLVQALGIDVVIGFARDARLGPLDFDAPGRWQFSDIVVAPLNPDFVITRWYCPTRSGLRAGELDVGLYGNSVVFVDPTIDDKLAALWDRIWRETGKDPEQVIPAYIEHVRTQRLTRILRTPPEPPRETKRSAEVLRFATTGDGARARAEGAVDESYWKERFPRVAITVDESAALPVTLDLSLEEPAETSAWTLRGPVVFGHGPLERWEGTDRPPFHVQWPREYRWSVEVPLPDGWDGAVGFEPVDLNHDAIQYRAWIVAGDDTLVLERQLVLHAGTWGAADLVEIDAVVTRMLDFERGDIVLRAPTESR